MRQLTGGIAGLFKANKVDGLVGHGKLLAGEQSRVHARIGRNRDSRSTQRHSGDAARRPSS